MSNARVLAGGLLLALVLSSATAFAQTAQTAPATAGSGIDVVELPSASSPLVALRLQFNVGSIHDPAGKEGLAALTAAMISDSGTQKRSYTDLVEALYPLAADISGNTDREVTLISGIVHRDKLADFTTLLEEAVLQPGFSQADFDRNKEQLVAGLTNGLRSNDEALGLELLQDEIFQGHPYGHSPLGTVEGLKSITLDDVKAFYKQHYTQAHLMLGVAGGYPAGYVAKLRQDLSALPQGAKDAKALPPAPKIEGRNFTLVEKQTGSVGIHFGFPLPINRADPDYYPLMVANSFLGEHRTSNGRLMQQLRGKRGLNYGDYSYVEYWANPPATNNPSPNVPRREQYFSVWIRPVVPADAQFALRDALYEVQRLRDQGMTKEELELAREFVVNYSKLWAQSLSRRLGFMMDSRYYGMPYYIDEIDSRLKNLTVDQVNAVIKKYLQTDDYDAVFVTANAQKLKETLEKDEPSPKTYNAKPDPDVVETDKTIQVLKVKPTSIRILPVDQVFQK
ncbi:MAG TPA: pitrilysin family protein [Thermoanaerobaculia bacterium]|jgi:zinc protease|nr:pitrilysin family protein [Thermoanaerobaculia bacterium]